ncbi:hypothetical protein JAAARDRAFT_503061 [Jaapia argillacea MUCL 33604]|uniref:Uncharacterized protein n=1 Tax=Jaapia argillacea MUCL 33604 TaxID=933084 RepID=A0A067PN16_9AGAM|nr:hypothetical protein JAAARDRAFT_503061 [Jaapia argillacea MUCL 33604]
MSFESILFTLALYKSACHFHSTVPDGWTGVSLFNVLARDSVLYFFVTFTAYLTNAVVWFALPVSGVDRDHRSLRSKPYLHHGLPPPPQSTRCLLRRSRLVSFRFLHVFQHRDSVEKTASIENSVASSESWSRHHQ